MDLGLNNKIAFVAGSSRGIGRAIAQAFLTEGARVVITGRNAESLNQTAAEFEAEFGPEPLLARRGDLSQPEEISEALSHTHERWGTLDCLVANIGSGTAKPGWDLSPDDWKAVFEANFWSSVRLTEAVLPGMLEAQRGTIIFISSIAGTESINAPITYSAAKASIVSYSKDLARQLGRYGIRFNCVAPGNILFPGGSWENKLAQDPERFQRYIETEVPLQRFGTPKEIADLVVFLASERAAFITGACIVADGGQTRGR
jgi:3-oxoacyl-[acyl-carrier protein] reductase